jgi:hypothetical protein
MGKTLTGLMAVLAFCGSEAQAAMDDDLTKTFAYCAGRLSAEVEHAWLVAGGDADLLEDRRDNMLTLLDSVVGDADAPEVLDLRIHAKQAHARLLRDASFHTDPTTAARARRLAMARIRACSSMLLG